MPDATGRPRRKRLSWESRCEIVAKVRLQGITPQVAAATCGVHRATVYRLVARCASTRAIASPTPLGSSVAMELRTDPHHRPGRRRLAASRGRSRLPAPARRPRPRRDHRPHARHPPRRRRTGPARRRPHGHLVATRRSAPLPRPRDRRPSRRCGDRGAGRRRLVVLRRSGPPMALATVGRWRRVPDRGPRAWARGSSCSSRSAGAAARSWRASSSTARPWASGAPARASGVAPSRGAACT